MGPGFRFGASPFAGVPSSDSSTAPTIEGVYLSGYGVVFTVTMDPPARDPWAKTDVAKAPPTLTEWDRTQRQMRGEPVPEKSASAKKDPPLGEVLLKLLSDNGKHFTALKDDERVILAITFRATTGPIQATPVSANPNVPGMAGMPFATQQPGGAAFAADPAGVRNPEPMIATYDWSHKAEGGASAELLGDMHLKQGQPQKAIEAYVKAVGQAESDAKGLGDDPHHRERISAAYLKLAQAYLAAGNLDEARTAMDQAKAAREKSARPSKPIGKTVAITLPIRLIFSAPKKLLDQVGNGQSTFEDFCKQVTVEYFMDSRNSF
jgi:tetratricopeptide (TPR) repeat protein